MQSFTQRFHRIHTIRPQNAQLRIVFSIRIGFLRIPIAAKIPMRLWIPDPDSDHRKCYGSYRNIDSKQWTTPSHIKHAVPYPSLSVDFFLVLLKKEPWLLALRTNLPAAGPGSRRQIFSGSMRIRIRNTGYEDEHEVSIRVFSNPAHSYAKGFLQQRERLKLSNNWTNSNFFICWIYCVGYPLVTG
jgi:hypothetical protein